MFFITIHHVFPGDQTDSEVLKVWAICCHVNHLCGVVHKLVISFQILLTAVSDEIQFSHFNKIDLSFFCINMIKYNFRLQWN